MNLLTVFTPTYNRKHTLSRTYESLLRQTCHDFEWLIIDDGSTDGTQEWVKSLAESLEMRDEKYDWMGRIVNGKDVNHFVIEHIDSENNKLKIEYVYKDNGGLYTGYNVAFQTIKTELCVCIDSDDYVPDDLVENVKKIWNGLSSEQKSKVAGIAGLDFNVVNKKPIGGEFPVNGESAWIQNLHHKGDSKYVFYTGLMKAVCPQIGFKGEKDFNPHYMQMQIFDKYPMWVVNKNFCWVEYQIGGDSMSQAIFKQYRRSPKSYARYRLMELSMTKGNSIVRKFSLCAHYVSACIFSHDGDWLKNSRNKWMIIFAVPLGILYNIYIKNKTNKQL